MGKIVRLHRYLRGRVIQDRRLSCLMGCGFRGARTPVAGLRDQHGLGTDDLRIWLSGVLNQGLCKGKFLAGVPNDFGRRV